jgi:hypothetical protein
MNNPQPWWLTWPPAEVAAAILPLFSSSEVQDERSAMASIVSWCKTGRYRASVFSNRSRFADPDTRAVAEAIQVLERAGLLMRGLVEPVGFGSGNAIAIFELGLTRLGMHTLHTNTVRQHLGLSGTPPTS